MKFSNALQTVLITCASGIASHASFAAEPPNVALGKPVTVNIPSTESYTKDKNPALLTDGKYAGADYDEENKASTLWVQMGALTWRVSQDPIVVTIDLGAVTPISGVTYSTAAGVAGVQFPSYVGIFVSDDAKSWTYQGNLVALSRKNGLPSMESYLKYRFNTHDLKTKGRYIALAIKQDPYTVTDEIEVYGGDNTWLSQPVSGPSLSTLDTPSINQIMQGSVMTNYVQRRVAIDIQTIRQLVEKASLPEAQKTNYLQQLDEARTQNELLELKDPNIKTNLPITETHRKVMALYGQLISSPTTSPLRVWQQHRYAWLPFITQPTDDHKVAIDIKMLKNQFRSDALLITNASGTPKMATLQLKNSPKGAKDGWLKIDSVAWTDTFQQIPVADALLPLNNEKGKYSTTIPGGFTGKLWFTVDSSKVPSGSFRSSLLVNGREFPFNVSVSKLAMQRPRMSLTMWDNADSKSLITGASRGITAKNKAAALAMMKSHFVDAPWADRPILPWATDADFDEQHQLKSSLNFSDFDQWVAEWPDARIFFIFISASEKEGFGGATRGTPEFKARVGAWAHAVASHIRKIGLKPQQVSLLINDEPGILGNWQDDVVADWAEAIHSTEPELNVMSDPTWPRPDLQKNQKAFTEMNLLMPNRQIYDASPPEVWDFFQKQRAAGRDLWLYACTGPIRMFNPQNYYRGQAWRVFSIGGKGMGYWAFNDIGKAPTAWHDYSIATSFSPSFLDESTVYNSIHWDAVREGVEDFEELAMLKDAIAATKNAELKAKAESVLQEAVKAVITPPSGAMWRDETNPERVDQRLQEVRTMLEQLSAAKK